MPIPVRRTSFNTVASTRQSGNNGDEFNYVIARSTQGVPPQDSDSHSDREHSSTTAKKRTRQPQGQQGQQHQPLARRKRRRKIVRVQNVVSPRIPDAFLVRNLLHNLDAVVDMDQGDSRIVQQFYQNHLETVEELSTAANDDPRFPRIGGSPVPVIIAVPTLFHTFGVAGDHHKTVHHQSNHHYRNADRRVTSFVAPQAFLPLTKRLLLRLDALESLNLAHRGSHEVPEWLDEFRHLTTLSVTIGEDQVLPASLARISTLQSLTVNGLKRATFPHGFGNLTRLKTLAMDGLEELPPQVFEAPNLRQVKISGEAGTLQRLPKAIGRLKHLVHFELEDADLEHHQLPDEFYSLQALRFLVITNCKISFPPGSISKLKNLQCLCINASSDTEPESPEQWKELGALHRLEDLHLCLPLTELPTSLVKHLPDLRRLHLPPHFLDFPVLRLPLLRLVQGCPRLGCLGYGYDEAGRSGSPDSHQHTIPYTLACHRAELRLDALTDPKFVNYPRPLSSRLSWWPLLLEHPRTLFGSYKVCQERGWTKCWCRTSKPMAQHDAIYYLLLHHGQRVAEARCRAPAAPRGTATTTTTTTSKSRAKRKPTSRSSRAARPRQRGTATKARSTK